MEKVRIIKVRDLLSEIPYLQKVITSTYRGGFQGVVSLVAYTINKAT